MKKVLIGILIGIIVGAGSLFAYNEFSVKKDNATKNNKKEETKKEEIKEEKLSIDDQLVQTLYDYVLADVSPDVDGYITVDTHVYRKWDLFEEIKNKGKINASDLSQEFKNYLGYRQLSVEELQKVNCSNYPNISYTSQVPLLCGSSTDQIYDPITNTIKVSDSATTSIINEEDLKKKVELIFGKNSYKSVDFFTLTCDLLDGYVYKKETKEYIYVSSYNGCGTDEYPTFKLISALRKDNKIYLNEKVERKASEFSEAINMEIKYTFNLSEDGNYYFESVEKIN